jgi:hypothetical protein
LIYLYDIALKQNFKSVYPNVYLAERSKLFKKVRDSMSAKDSNISLPLIGIWRTENSLDSDRRNFAEFKQGEKGYRDEQAGEVVLIKGINIPLTYQIDILGNSLQQCDDILTDTLVFLYENPVIKFSKDGIEFYFNVAPMDLSISTDYASFDEAGEIHSQTLTVQVAEARILYTQNKKIWKNIIQDLTLSDNVADL